METNYKKEFYFNPEERVNLDQDTHMTIEVESTDFEDWLEVCNCTFCDCQGDNITNRFIDKVIFSLDLTINELMDKVSNYYTEIEKITIGLDYYFYVSNEKDFNNAILEFVKDGKDLKLSKNTYADSILDITSGKDLDIQYLYDKLKELE